MFAVDWVQVPRNRIVSPSVYYNYSYPNPKYPIIGHMHPSGLGTSCGLIPDLGLSVVVDVDITFEGKTFYAKSKVRPPRGSQKWTEGCES